MDFSQLPKMSKTPPAAADAEVPPAVASDAPVDRPAAPPPSAPYERPYARPDIAYSPGGGFGFGGVWVSLISGVLCLLFGLRFGRWAVARVTGNAFDSGSVWQSGDLAGQPVAYFDLLGGAAWTEMGLFLMGVALLLDAALMFVAFRGRSPHRALVLAAVALTGTALLINVGTCVYLLSLGVLPIVSLVALLVGGMVLFDHVPLLKRR